MYHVEVFERNGLAVLDSQDFKFGTWAEIGFWLDNFGYNDMDYRVVITFTS